jgi:hydroxylamine reductase
MRSNKHQKTDEETCMLTGTCSISPFLSSVHTVILVYLEELAFYLVELKTLGTTNEKIKEDIIQVFSELITNIEYNQDKLNYSISTIYQDLYNAKELYKRLCKKNNIKQSPFKSSITISKSFTVTQAITQGQNFFLKKVENIDNEQKKLIEIMLILAKSICIYVTELKWLNTDYDEAYEVLVNILSLMNFNKLTNKNLEEIIKKYTKLDHNFMLKVFEAKKALFGKLIASNVAISTRVGKAILVSGNNLKELELILEATKDKNIDVYTHGEMLIAHAFEKLKAYPNLVGHFGKGIEYSLSDFANFEGAIFLTKLSLHKIKTMYHGSVFTSDTNSPKGITIIKENDFEPLIQAALCSKGFTKSQEHESIEVGIDEEYFIEKIHEVADKINAGEIKHVFMAGVPNKTEAQKDYFKRFLNLLGDDCFAISFTDTPNINNVLYMDVDYSTPFVYIALNIFIQKNSFKKMKSVVLFTKCEPHTIPTIFNMKYMGINDIYFTNCPSDIIDPALTDWMKKTLKLKTYTNPQSDFNYMIREISD